MPMVFAVRDADNRQVRLNRCGLTADRLFIQKIISVSGKSFTIVNANRYGGLGATSARRQNLAIARFGTIMMMI
jgi:hypothetical protein